MNPTLLELGLTPESEPPTGYDPEDFTHGVISDGDFPILSVAIDVSGRCNLACHYCAEAASQPRRASMSVEVMEAAVKLLEHKVHSGARPSVRIGSGEPFLALPLLRRLHVLLSEIPEPIDVFITTNGTLIDDDTADWLASTGWRIKFSLDGPQHIHDAWRRTHNGKPTFERVTRVVRKMAESCSERVSVAAVLCRGADPTVVFEAIESLGVKRIELVPVACNSTMRERDIRLITDDVLAYVNFINEYAWAIFADGRKAHPALVRFEEVVLNLMGYGITGVKCGAGRSYVCIGSNGSLYPCFRFAGIEEFRIGDVRGGLDTEAARAFRMKAGRETTSRKRCSTCWATLLCGGPCFSVAEFFSDVDGMPDEMHCAYKLADARAASWLVSNLRQRDMEKLVQFLPENVEL